MPKPVSVTAEVPNAADDMRSPTGTRPDSEDTRVRAERVKSRPVVPLAPVSPPTPGSGPPPVRPKIDTEQAATNVRRPWWLPFGFRGSASWVTSLLFHAALILVLGLMVQATRPGAASHGLTAYIARPVPLESFDRETPDALQSPRRSPIVASPMPTDRDYGVPRVEQPAERPSDGQRGGRAAASSSLPPKVDWMKQADADVKGSLAGRGQKARALLAGRDGGTDQSEAAVERGLRWLAAHQQTDGSWHFNHENGLCQGQCRNPGTAPTTTGATAIVLLPFLGAGYTHRENEYQEVVRRGLYYLGNRALLTPHGVDLQEGTMYAQGLATIALCEAYAMTDDKALKDIAQSAIDFIVYAQDRKGGGWRYTPGEPGDTTVIGWQLMALKSGQMANLNVPSPTIFKAKEFLTSVQCEGGARYGYMNTSPRQTTTAIGLLLRMYTGWQRDNLRLRQGVVYHLSKWGPSEDNMYYNYYATQVMHHWGGPEWDRWNGKMRDFLVATQAATGHEAGSWYFGGGYGQVGGRLYNTAMAAMTLEVYYRYMPLYRRESILAEQ